MSEQLELIPREPKPLTARQQEVLRYIARYIGKHGFPPSTNDLCAHFRFTSNAAADHIRALVRKGALRKAPGVARGISLPKHND